MKNSRRDFVKKIGVAAAIGAVLPNFRNAAQAADSSPGAAASPAPSKPTANALCVLSFSRGADGPHVGALAPNDPTHLVDLAAVAKRTGAKLSFHPASMLTFIAAGERALAEMKDLLAKAQPADGIAIKT